MNRVNHTFSSIEQVTDQFLTTKTKRIWKRVQRFRLQRY